MWVTTYKVTHSNDGFTWLTVADVDNQEITFIANVDKSTAVGNAMPPALIARFIRLNPQGWHTRIAVRWGIVGCPVSET